MLVDAIVVFGLFGTILVPREAQAVIIDEALVVCCTAAALSCFVLVDAIVVFGLFGTILVHVPYETQAVILVYTLCFSS